MVVGTEHRSFVRDPLGAAKAWAAKRKEAIQAAEAARAERRSRAELAAPARFQAELEEHQQAHRPRAKEEEGGKSEWDGTFAADSPTDSSNGKGGYGRVLPWEVNIANENPAEEATSEEDQYSSPDSHFSLGDNNKPSRTKKYQQQARPTLSEGDCLDRTQSQPIFHSRNASFEEESLERCSTMKPPNFLLERIERRKEEREREAKAARQSLGRLIRQSVIESKNSQEPPHRIGSRRVRKKWDVSNSDATSLHVGGGGGSGGLAGRRKAKSPELSSAPGEPVIDLLNPNRPERVRSKEAETAIFLSPPDKKKAEEKELTTLAVKFAQLREDVHKQQKQRPQRSQISISRKAPSSSSSSSSESTRNEREAPPAREKSLYDDVPRINRPPLMRPGCEQQVSNRASSVASSKPNQRPALAPTQPRLAGEVHKAPKEFAPPPKLPGRRKSTDDVDTRKMFDKRHSRKSNHEPFRAAIALWRQKFPEGRCGAATRAVTCPNVSVFVRKRPLFKHEQTRGEYDCVTVPPSRLNSSSKEVVVHNCQMHPDLKRMYIKHQSFLVSKSFDEAAQNNDVFSDAAVKLVQHAVDGGTAALFMYGQTGSGKTYTMASIEEAAAYIFSSASSASTVRAHLNYFEIAGKRCIDLLSPSGSEIILKEAEKGVELIGAQSATIDDENAFMAALEQGKSRRATSSTFCNAASSRSHAVIKILIERRDGSAGSLMLIDCAGSERKEDNMHHDANQRKETAEINASLYALKECMRMRRMQLTGSQQSVYVPYRSSQLTRVLMECFVRDDAAMAVIGTISPSASDIEHSICTLKTVHLIGGGENDGAVFETKEDVPKNLKFDVDGRVVLDDTRRELPPVQWKHADVKRWLASAKGGKWKEIKISSAIDGRALVRMTPQSLCGLCNGNMKSANELYEAVRDEVARIAKARVSS